VLVVAFVPDYRCGTAPEYHWIPFLSTTVPAIANRSTLPYTVYSNSVNTKCCVFARIRQTGYLGGKSYFYYEFWLLLKINLYWF
jgi:hypothetical protein